MRSIIKLFIPLILVVAAAIAQTTAPSTSPSKTVWDGVYTTEQVALGRRGYNTLCARCHGDTLLGNDDAPALVGKDFMEKWYGKSVGAMVDLTQKEMPSDGPGKLTRKQCTDITAYVLNANNFPAGRSELMPDLTVLNGILIEPKK